MVGIRYVKEGQRGILTESFIEEELSNFTGTLTLYIKLCRCTIKCNRGNMADEVKEVIRYIKNSKSSSGSFSFGNGDYAVWRMYVPILTRCTDIFRRYLLCK